MKSFIKILFVAVCISMVIFILPQKATAQVSIQVFYDQLSPFGQWANYSDYGYAWIPSVSPDFSPYATNGYWVFTDFGWTWVSDYSWGWAAFHYGRWVYDPVYGWIWIPDTEWAPAWVAWRRAPGFYGWAPLEPGISLNVIFSGGWQPAPERWVFVKEGDIIQHNISNYYINRTQNVTIIKNTTIINNVSANKTSDVRYISGPSVAEVQKITGKTIQPVTVRDASTPGHNLTEGELHIYKPVIKKETSANKKPAPAKLASLKDIKPLQNRVAERTENSKPTTEDKQVELNQNPTPNDKDKTLVRDQKPSMNAIENEDHHYTPRQQRRMERKLKRQHSSQQQNPSQ